MTTKPDKSAEPRLDRGTNAGEIIGLVWGGVFATLGFVIFAFGGHRFGLAMVAFGGLILPPVSRAIRKHLGAFKTPLLPALIAVMGALAVAVLNPIGMLQGSTGDNAPADPRARQVLLERDLQSIWSELQLISLPCEQAAAKVSASLEGLPRSGSVQAYEEAKAGEQICGQVGLAVAGIHRPTSLPTTSRKALDAALDQCAWGYAGRSVMFKEMAKVVDGDRRSSQISKVSVAGRTATDQIAQCVVGMMSVADANGVTFASGPPSTTDPKVS